MVLVAPNLVVVQNEMTCSVFFVVVAQNCKLIRSPHNYLGNVVVVIVVVVTNIGTEKRMQWSRVPLWLATHRRLLASVAVSM